MPCAAAFHARRSMTLISACELHRFTSTRPFATTRLACYKNEIGDGNSCRRRSPLFTGGSQLTSSARRSGLATVCGLVNATIRGLSRSDAFGPDFRSATAALRVSRRSAPPAENKSPAREAGVAGRVSIAAHAGLREHHRHGSFNCLQSGFFPPRFVIFATIPYLLD